MRFTVNKVLTEEEAVALLQAPRERLAVDIETVSLVNHLPLGIAIAIDKDTGFYFFNPRDKLCQAVIGDAPTVILHNSSYDLPILGKYGYNIQHYEDTMLMAYAAGIMESNLNALSMSLLMRDCPSVTSLWKKKDQGNVAIDHVKLAGISIIHACNTYAIYEKLPKTQLYLELDKPCNELVLEMEKYGLIIDQYHLTRVEQAEITKATKLEAELYEALGVFNLASNVKMAEALKAKGILGTRKTKSGKDAVSEESLRPLNHPTANKVLKHRSIMKTLTTYVPAFRSTDQIGRIHTNFGYTETGRWKSRRPNLQNITRDEKFIEEEE